MAWILDVVFFVMLLVGAIIGGKIGFVKGASKVAGWLLSIIIPITFCMAFKDVLEQWFGLETYFTSVTGGTPALGGWITAGISFVALFIIIKLGTWLIGLIGTALINAVKAFKVVNSILGTLLGIFETFLIIVIILLICSWLPIESMQAFINESYVVGAIFRSNLIGLLPGMIPEAA